MSKTFDPYKQWLSIPPDERPIDHYRLLGIEHFTEEVEAIRTAADRRMVRVKSFQHGPHSDESQKLLNEIAKAQICLLDETRKAKYDKELQHQLEELKPPAPSASKPPVQQPPRPLKSVVSDAPPRTKMETKGNVLGNDEVPSSTFPWSLVATVAVSVSAVSIALFVSFTIYFSKQADEFHLASVIPSSKSTSHTNTTISIEDQVVTDGDIEVFKVDAAAQAPKPKSLENNCGDGETRSTKLKETKSPPPTNESAPKRIVKLTPKPIPAISPPTSSEPPTKVAVKQENSRPVSSNDEIQKLIDETIVPDADVSQYIAVLQRIEARTDEVLMADDLDVANHLAELAESTVKKTRNRLLIRRVKALQNRVREIEKEFAKVKIAKAMLAEKPDDGPAHTIVGKYRCLVQNNWDKGLPHLANGSHSGLKQLAAHELQNPVTADDQVQLGDAWWDAATRAGFRERQLYRQRAVYWYEVAIPQLSDMQQGQVTQRVREHQIAVADGWHIVFKSNNPEYWNTDVVDGDQFAVPLNEVGLGVQFLRIRRRDVGEQVIIPMNRQILEAGGVISPLVMWKTPANSNSSVPLLGVANSALVVSPAHPWLEIKEDESIAYTGWGFGAVSSGGSTQMQIWQGAAIDDVELEISVKYTDLSKDERAFLLR